MWPAAPSGGIRPSRVVILAVPIRAASRALALPSSAPARLGSTASATAGARVPVPRALARPARAPGASAALAVVATRWVNPARRTLSARSVRCAATTVVELARRRHSTVRVLVSTAFKRGGSRARAVISASAFRLPTAAAAPTVPATKSATRARSAKMAVATRRAVSVTTAARLVAVRRGHRNAWRSAAARAHRAFRLATPRRASVTAPHGPAKARQEAPQSPPVPKLVLPRDPERLAGAALLVTFHLHRGANVHDLIAIGRG